MASPTEYEEREDKAQPQGHAREEGGSGLQEFGRASIDGEAGDADAAFDDLDLRGEGESMGHPPGPAARPGHPGGPDGPTEAPGEETGLGDDARMQPKADDPARSEVGYPPPELAPVRTVAQEQRERSEYMMAHGMQGSVRDERTDEDKQSKPVQGVGTTGNAKTLEDGWDGR